MDNTTRQIVKYVSVVEPDELRRVTPDATAKTHFIIVDAVGVCESELKALAE